MSRLVLPVSLLLLSLASYAQDQTGQHFVYVQTENNQPFYIRMDGKVFSSTAGGYIILPKLASGNYQLFAGFPKNEFPEQEFHITISGVNEGFLLKKLGTNWSLFNIETLALTEGVNTVPVQPEPKSAPQSTTTGNDPFAALLAGAVKDSSILQNDIVTTPPQKKPDTLQTVVTTPIDTNTSVNTGVQPTKQIITINETPQTNNTSTEHTPADTPADVTTLPVRAPSSSLENTVQRILLVNEKGGLELVYVDRILKDTIRIFLPVSPDSAPQNQTAKVIYNPPAQDTTSFTITPTTAVPDTDIPEKKKNDVSGEKKPEAPGQIIYNPRPDTPVTSEKTSTSKANVTDVKTENTPRVIYNSDVNSDCHDFATNKDFLKLRKRMAAETDNDKMIEVAKKSFKSKCFSTEQLRNLSYLFLDDEGRYKFFDAAYPFTSDSDQYSSLEAQLNDTYYINRFRAMIHK